MMRHRWLVAAVAFAFGLIPPSAAGAPAPDPIKVRIQPQATLVAGSIDVTVRVKCAPFGEHFESLITLNQDDYLIFAERHLPVVRCDSHWHAYPMRATPFGGEFHPGSVFASAYVSRQDPVTGDLREGSASRTVRVR